MWKVIRQCLICIHWEGGPFKTPPFAPLPGYVVGSSNNIPFNLVGIDYLGPLIINDYGVVKKTWVCLFTCLQIRAIHLELVENTMADSFLCCLRRFIARRGKPKMIICDNASQIKAGNAVIDLIWKKVTKDVDVQHYVSNEYWKYIVEYAPWRGGYYERLVGLTKRSLKKTLGTCKVGREQLHTILQEIEAVINT